MRLERQQLVISSQLVLDTVTDNLVGIALLEDVVNQLVKYREETRKVTKRLCRTIDPDAACLDDLGSAPLLEWRVLMRSSTYLETLDSGDFDDLVTELMHNGMQRMVELMNEERGLISNEIVECKALLAVWRKDQRFRLLEYRLDKPLGANHDEDCLKAFEHLQYFNTKVNSKLEGTRLILCERQARLQPIFRKSQENSKVVQLEGSQTVEEYCKRIIRSEYKRQENLTEKEVFCDVPHLEVVYPTIIHILTLGYQGLWDRLEILARQLSEADQLNNLSKISNNGGNYLFVYDRVIRRSFPRTTWKSTWDI
jgi:hypothetical protein